MEFLFCIHGLAELEEGKPFDDSKEKIITFCPKAYWEEFGYLPDDKAFIDKMPLRPEGYSWYPFCEEVAWRSSLPKETIFQQLTKLGFIWSDELHNFLLSTRNS